MYKNTHSLTVLRITLFAFLINALLPFFAVYNFSHSQANASEMSSIFGDKILICTSDGFKWVSLEDIENGTDLPTEHPKYECALCFVSNKEDNKFVPVEYTLAHAPSVESKHSRFYELDFIQNQSFYNIALTRAPPFSS